MESLCKAYENYFKIGVAVSAPNIDTHADLIRTHFNSITCENEMKPCVVQPKPGVFDFTKTDKIVNFARENHIPMRGHTFVWHNQMPKWFFTDDKGAFISRSMLLSRVREHMQVVMERYKDDVWCWDVVNEAVFDDDAAPEKRYNDTLRRSPWTEIVGDDFIVQAFKIANEVNPDAKLLYNDYCEYLPNKRERIYKIVKNLIDSGVRIDAVGMQSHWHFDDPTLDMEREAIERYASLGLKVQMTEMDLSVYEDKKFYSELHQPDPEYAALPPEVEERQAQMYGKFFAMFREYKDVIESVNFWNPSDEVSWLNGFPVPGRKNYPLLFGADHKPKKAFYSVVNF